MMRDNRPLLPDGKKCSRHRRSRVGNINATIVGNGDFAVRSVDARDRTVSMAERWSDDSVFSNRAHFILDKHPAQLGVDRIKEEDAGIYRCRVDFQIGQTRNSKVNLTVIGKSSSPRFSPNPSMLELDRRRI